MAIIKARRAMESSLYEQWRAGVGTKKQKDETGGTPGTIHSNITFKTYKAECDRYADWLQEHGWNRGGMPAAREHAGEYLQERIAAGLSASSVHTTAAALAKALRCRATDFGVRLPERRRSEITRSRLPVERDKHFSAEKHKDLLTFCACTGLRRHELAKLRGTDCTVSADGSVSLTVKGKGGRVRTVRAVGSKAELTTVRRLILTAKDGLVFAKVPQALDVHALRSVFCARVYQQYARPAEHVPTNERYICRADRCGAVYDKRAMRAASEALGHSRLDVIAGHYSVHLPTLGR